MTTLSRTTLVATTAAGCFLLLDSLRVWLPSLTTIFGSAGMTSAITLALFALAWVLPLVLLVPLAASRYGRWSPLIAAAIIVATRITLQSSDSAQLQLYASSIATCASLAWLIAVAARGWSPRDCATGFAIGLGATTLMQLATAGVDLTWQAAWSAWPLLALASAILLLGCWHCRDEGDSGGGALWFAVMPALLLGGLITIAIGRTWTGIDWPPPGWSGALIGAAAIAGILIALRGGWSRHGWLTGPLLLVTTALADLPRDGEAFPAWIALPQALLAFLIPAALAHAAQARTSSGLWRGFAAYGGLLLGFVLAVAYYVAFDMLLPIPRPAFVLAIAALLAVTALTKRSEAVEALSPASKGVAALACIVGVVFAFFSAPVPPAATNKFATWPLKVMSYNIRYGISNSGRFDPDAIADAIAAQSPDIVMLQEVDRGFLVNGSHDVLALLQKRLHMYVYYNPASEPLFGDAILSRWPLQDVLPVALPTYDVATRPGVLSGVLRLDDGSEVVLAVSHLHEKEDGVDIRQVRDLAAHLDARMTDRHRLLILAGDYNLEPGDMRLQPLLTKLYDGLADARPLPTWPSSHPVQQLDYLFLSAGLRATDMVAPSTQASDHLPVAANIERTSDPAPVSRTLR